MMGAPLLTSAMNVLLTPLSLTHSEEKALKARLNFFKSQCIFSIFLSTPLIGTHSLEKYFRLKLTIRLLVIISSHKLPADHIMRIRITSLYFFYAEVSSGVVLHLPSSLRDNQICLLLCNQLYIRSWHIDIDKFSFNGDL